MMDLLNQLPFLDDLPPALRDVVLNAILVVCAIVIIIALRWILTGILVRPLRILTRRTAGDLDDTLLDEILTPIRIAVVGFSLIIAVNLLQFGAELQSIAETVGRSLIIGAVFFGFIRVFEVVTLRPALFRRVTGLTIPDRLLPFVNTVVSYSIGALGAIFVLQELDFDVAALIASLGIVGIGISLASKDTVANLFGFAAIVSDNPFKVGDFIETPDVTGIVEKVGMRSSRVRQLDQTLVTVPNNLLTNTVVLNMSRREKRRLSTTLTFTYDTSAEQLRAAVEQIRDLLQNTGDIDPESVIVHFAEYNASSLDVLVVCQVTQADFRAFVALREKVYLDIMGIVEALGISFAFPSQSLYIEQLPGADASVDDESDTASAGPGEA